MSTTSKSQTCSRTIVLIGVGLTLLAALVVSVHLSREPLIDLGTDLDGVALSDSSYTPIHLPHARAVTTGSGVYVHKADVAFSGGRLKLGTLCDRHKALLKDVAEELKFSGDILTRMTCERLERGVADWYNRSGSGPFHLYRLISAVERLERGEPVKIAVIGGSMTAGHAGTRRDDWEGARLACTARPYAWTSVEARLDPCGKSRTRVFGGGAPYLQLRHVFIRVCHVFHRACN